MGRRLPDAAAGHPGSVALALDKEDGDTFLIL